MNAAIVLVSLLVFGGVLFLAPDAGPGALIVCVLASIPTGFVVSRTTSDRAFLMRLLVLGVLVRVVLGTVIYLAHLEEFFGGDAITYDFFGAALNASWHGDAFSGKLYQNFVGSGVGAWGMLYVVAAVYELIGRNPFAIQLLNASIGSATAVAVYYVASLVFENRRVARIAAVMACFFPSLILWSSQALKDGMIVFCLAMSILMTLKLMTRIKVLDVVVLTFSLFGLLSLRFYIFYMMVVAVIGAFIIGAKTLNAQGLLSRFAAVVAIGLAFTWFGVLRIAGTQFERYGNLEAVQRSRADAARSAESGFAKDVDVGTTEGALSAIPIGLLYLFFAPFPWQLVSLRQSITLPEMIVWWASVPFLILGAWYALKHKLRKVSPILLFTSMLTLAYSLFQGNVGTAYRQRSQLMVFYFLFVAVGVVLTKERMEDIRRRQVTAKLQLAEHMAALQAERKKARARVVQQS